MYAPLIAPSIPCSGETNLAQTKPSMIPANAAAIWPTVKSQKRSFDSRWAGAVCTIEPPYPFGNSSSGLGPRGSRGGGRLLRTGAGGRLLRGGASPDAGPAGRAPLGAGGGGAVAGGVLCVAESPADLAGEPPGSPSAHGSWGALSLPPPPAARPSLSPAGGGPAALASTPFATSPTASLTAWARTSGLAAASVRSASRSSGDHSPIAW